MSTNYIKVRRTSPGGTKTITVEEELFFCIQQTQNAAAVAADESARNMLERCGKDGKVFVSSWRPIMGIPTIGDEAKRVEE